MDNVSAFGAVGRWTARWSNASSGTLAGVTVAAAPPHCLHGAAMDNVSAFGAVGRWTARWSSASSGTLAADECK